MQVLAHLAARAGRVVSRTELEDSVWAGTVVGTEAVTNTVIKLRKVLGDDARDPRIIETIPKRGYRLIAEVAPAHGRRGGTGEQAANSAGAGRFPRVAPVWWQGAAALLAGIVAASLLAWWRPWAADLEAASRRDMAFPLPDQPSIAVLPFENLGGDAEDRYLGDGLTESLIIGLSKIPNLFVIAPHAAFAVRDADATRAAEALGVRYVLQGSVQNMADSLRIHAQLVDALTGERVWAERYDREQENLLALQDNIADKVVTTLVTTLTEGAQARAWRGQTGSPEAFAYYLRGLEHKRRFTAADNARARHFFERAVATDSEFAIAWTTLAATHFLDARYSWSDDPGASLARAERLARRALALDETLAETHAILGDIALIQRQYDEALVHCKEATTLNPGALTLAMCAEQYNHLDYPSRALKLIRSAMRRSPYHPGWYHYVVGQSHRLLGNHDLAIEAFENWERRNPDHPNPHLALAVTHYRAGRHAEARAEVAEALERNPGLTISQVRKAILYRDPQEVERILDALRKSGIPGQDEG